MSINNKSVFRWFRLAGYLGAVFLLLACMVFSGAQLSDDGLFRLDNNIVKVQNEDGDWVPVGGASFELVGELESTDPWSVAGAEFETRETTEIEAGLEVGDLVKVRGVILEDDTWVAYSIELSDQQTDPIIILIGTVDSMDPWVVDGITLTVTAETDIQGDIKVGMIVRVEILLLPDGTWEVLSIALLGETTEISGCATVLATVVSVDGNAVQFLGWPAAVILELTDDDQASDNEENDNDDEDDNDGDEGGDDDDENEDADDGDNNGIDGIVLTSDQVVLAVVCVADNGQLVIVQIFILNIDIDINNGDDGNSSGDGGKALVCHKPDKKGGHTLSISSSAVPAHLGHGDTLGACP